MRTPRRSFALLIPILCGTHLHAQTQPQAPTIHTNANLTIVDVTVTDKQGHPIHNLKQSDFTLLENKSPQTLKSFEEHAGLSAADASKLKPAPKMPPGVFTNETSAPANGALNILLLDTLNTSMPDQAFVRQQLLNYLEKEKPGTNVAIFGLNTRLILLQDFTSDHETLKQAVMARKDTNVSPLLEAPASKVDNTMKTSDYLLKFGDVNRYTMARVMEFETTQTSARTEQRTQITLNAMNQLARYLSGIPGRKNLIWFSASFPITILADPTLQARAFRGTGIDLLAGVASNADEFRQTVDLFSRSQVAVYPVYAKGFIGMARYSADLHAPPNQDKIFSQEATDLTTMEQIAYETGGTFAQTNDLSDAVAKAIDHGSDYYSLSYTPSKGKGNNDYRSIQVKLQQQGYTLAYRRGYYADDPNPRPTAKTIEVAAKTSDPAAPSDGAMQLAMKYGAPPATQIPFKVRFLPASDAAEDQPAPGNQLNPNPKKAAAPFHRYAIDYLADAAPLGFEHTPDGKYRDDLEYVVCVYDLDGNLINVASNNLGLSLTAAQRATIMQRGLPYHLEVSIPAKGHYMVRIAIHDLKTNSIGAIEVPAS